MTEDRKYFGMTSTQVGILAGLAGALCLIFCVGGWLMFGGLPNFSFFPPPSEAPVPQGTATLFLTPTQIPTQTPTPIPYEQLIPSGWVQYRTGLVELWLPPEFKPATAKVFGDTLEMGIPPELVATGAVSKLSSYKMLVVVTFEPFAGDSLDDFLTERISALPAVITVGERRKVFVNSTEARRLTFQTRDDNIEITVLTYVFRDGNTVWYIDYYAQINEFFEMLPTFEESIQTFRITRQ